LAFLCFGNLATLPAPVTVRLKTTKHLYNVFRWWQSFQWLISKLTEALKITVK